MPSSLRSASSRGLFAPPEGVVANLARGSRRSFVVVSTFPPTACGIATFSAALSDGLAALGADVGVVRVGGAGLPPHPRVVGEVGDARAPSAAAVRVMNEADVVIVQHEYGLFGGPDGAAVVGLLRALDVPSIVVAHTVLQAPSPGQRAVLRAVAEEADGVVVMTEAGRTRLCSAFGVDPAKVMVIPHGAAARGGPAGLAQPARDLLTWGLLGPGKGIEWAIDAVALLADVPVRYRVAGVTHPKVAAVDGEAYREMLVDRAVRAGVSARVTFDAGYRGLDDLQALIRSSAVVVLPYDSPDQVTSGVLVDAVAAGRPVVATAFPHAEELLASGAGLVVPQRDPDALAHALRRVLTEPGLAEQLAAEAARLAPGLAWPAVAATYAAFGEALIDQRDVMSA